MTDRHAAYVVTLAEDIREDDAEALVIAMGMLRGVIMVRPVVADVELHIAEERARHELGRRVLNALHNRSGEGAS